MVANGGNTGKKWRKEIRVLELITDVQWQLVVRFANKYVELNKTYNLMAEKIHLTYLNMANQLV